MHLHQRTVQRSSGNILIKRTKTDLASDQKDSAGDAIALPAGPVGADGVPATLGGQTACAVSACILIRPCGAVALCSQLSATRLSPTAYLHS